MYERFFGFRERPFDLTPNPRYLVLTAAHREAISNIEYGIVSRKGITLLMGEAGSGKTTVIRAAAERQIANGFCVHLQNPAFTRSELIEMLAVRFGLSERARDSKAALLVELEALLLRRRAAGQTTVLIVDEAQCLPLNLLEEIRLLVNLETDDEKLLSVVLAGQPDLVAMLDGPSVRQFKQRIALWCELRRLTLDETATYILSRIQAAGGNESPVFTREAVTLIHGAASGVPRSINVLADNALLTAFAADERPVTSRIVKEVCRDFYIKQPALASEMPAATSLDGLQTSGAAESLSDSGPALFAGHGQASNHEKQPERSMFARVLRRYSL